MKKIFGFLMAAAVLFGAASCAKEDISSSIANGEQVEVTFTANLPELGTRAETYGLGDKANTLRCYVYDAATGAELPALQRTVPGQGTFTFSLPLIKGMKYDFVLWADHNGCYEINDKVVTISYENANDNERDAFYGYETNFDPTTDTPKFYLYRPFAQLNAATNDKTAVVNSGVDFTTMTSTVKLQAYNKFDITKGTIADDAELVNVEFAATEVPATSGETIKAGYEYLSMNYILVPADKNLFDVEFIFKGNRKDNGPEVTFTGTSYTSVPLQRNYRTNILGSLLTKSTEFEVEILPGFDGTEVVDVWDGQSVDEPTVDSNDANIYIIEKPNQLAWLAAAVNGTLTEDYTRATVAANDFAGKTFVLTEDIELGGQEWTPIGTSATPFKGTFDGQGHIIKNLVVSGYNSNVGLFGYTTDGEVKNFTVQDAKVSGRLNVGVVAGTPYTTKYTNITVKGHVEVNGMAYVGGVGGKNAYADWTNITVDVDDTSYVKANSVENGTAYRTYVGGVVGFNGEGGHTFSNISSNIAVEGSTCDVGGLFGIAHYGNQFVNCVCAGNVTITTDEAENALEMGGIAGVWHNETGYTVTLTNCEFSGNLTTNIEGVDFYYNGLVGAPYSATGTGKLIIGGKQYVANATQLQAALNAATGESTIYLGADIVGTVTAVQKDGVKVTIDGENKKYNGVIKVHSNSNYYADAALTIKNVNFETSAAGVNVIEALENGSERYSNNITVENCTFTATGEAVNTSVAVQVKATRGVTVTGCTATNMHSLIQAQSCDTGDVKVVNCTVNGKNGVAFKQVKAATVEGTTITALEYGIRFDGNIDNYGIVVKNNNVTAVQPLIVRKMTGKNNTITLEGTNTLTTGTEYQIVVTNGSDDEEYVKPTGTYTLTGADAYTCFPAPFPVASWDEFTAALAAGEDYIKLTEDITYAKSYDLKKNVKLDLGGKSLEISDPSLMLNIHSVATIKNGTIKGKVYARTNSNITFDGVTFGGSINGGGSIEASLQIQGACNVYAKNCSFNATNSNSTKSRPLSIQSTSSGTYKFEGCSFKSNTNQNQVYVNPLGGTATLDFTNCNFNSKTPNIMLAAAYPFTNVTMTGTTKLSSVTLEINRAKDAVTADDLAYLRTLIANNSFSSVRVFYAGGSSEYIR